MIINLTCNVIQDIVYATESPHMSIHIAWESILTSGDMPEVKLYLSNINGKKELILGSEFTLSGSTGSEIYQLYNIYTNNIIVTIDKKDATAGNIVVNKNGDTIWVS